MSPNQMSLPDNMRTWKGPSMEFQVHIIDDDDLVCQALERLITRKGHRVTTSRTGVEALYKLCNSLPDLIFLDLSLPDMHGIEVLVKIRENGINAPTVIISGYGTVETAVEALKLGARDFLTKPLNLAKVNATVENILSNVKLQKEVDQIRHHQMEVFLNYHLIGKSASIQRCYQVARNAATNDRLTVLITGESGTGKEVLARYVHYHSPRSQNPLITVNCGAIPKDLVESELFGYEKGAFTGALQSGKPGRFELADQGTLLLDEIGDLQIDSQVKILRFLQEKEVQRVGSTRTRRLDVRVITATNQDLENLVRLGRFREDLYYRLNVIRIHLPPLREHKEDILPLVLHYIDIFNKEFGKKVTDLSQAARKGLLNYSWPGNIRELRNVMERGIHLCNSDVLEEEHILVDNLGVFPHPTGVSYPEKKISLDEMEHEYVRSVLESCGGNKSKAAQILDISRARLRRILEGNKEVSKVLGIKDPTCGIQ